MLDIQAQGFQEMRVKNFWGPGDGYQGINSVFISRTGQRFELQFHTPESLSMKEEECHSSYAKFRSATDSRKMMQYWEEMVSMWDMVPVPEAVLTIPEVVQQKLELQWDLTAVKAVPGLELHLHLQPFAERSVQRARPEVAQEGATRLDWQPQPAMTNRLVLRCWRWSALGLGAVAIAALLSLTVVLRAQLDGLKAPAGPGQRRD